MHARIGVQQRQDGVKDSPANVFEVHIDSRRSGGGQLVREIRGAVVDGGVESQRFPSFSILLGTAA
jgi:hypothetical protein